MKNMKKIKLVTVDIQNAFSKVTSSGEKGLRYYIKNLANVEEKNHIWKEHCLIHRQRIWARPNMKQGSTMV